MPDLPLLPRSDHQCVQIRHRQNPLSYIIEGEQTDDTHRSQIYCKILSNSYFYTTLLSQLESYPSFESLFYQCLVKLLLNEASARLCFQPVFSYAIYRNNSIRLRVDPRLNRFDEWINRRWASIQLRVLIRRIRYETSWAWLSTLGGGHSCLGEVSLKHALEAEEISKNQIVLSKEIGDPNALVKSYLFLALSYMQQKRFDEVAIILRYQYCCIQGKDITDERLPIMCIALWKKMKYNMKKEKQS